MLIEKIEGVRVFKLVTGEEVVGRCTQRDNGNFSVTSPLRIVVQRAGNGEYAPAFTAWLATSRDDQEYEIYANQLIVVPYEPPSEFHNAYVQATSRLDLSAAM